MKPLIFALLVLSSQVSYALSESDLKKESLNFAVKVCFSKPKGSLLRTLFDEVQKASKTNNDYQLAANCLTATLLVSNINRMAIHFGFKPSVDRNFIEGLMSKMERQDFSQGQSRLKRLSQIIPIAEYNLDEIQSRLEQYLIRDEVKAEIFKNTWNQALLESNRMQFLETLSVSYLVGIGLRLQRPRLDDGGPLYQTPYFFLGYRAALVDPETDQDLATGYSETDHFYVKDRSPNKKATQWAQYKIGYHRTQLYPEDQSQFIMLHRFPFSYVRPEHNIIQMLGGEDQKDATPLVVNYGVSKAGHDLFILRYEGIEYITLEGRPCLPTENRNLYNCELPISFSLPSLQKVYSTLSQ